MGFFSGLNSEKYDRQYPDKVLVKRISNYFKPQYKRLVGIAVIVIYMASISALMPIAVSRGVDILTINQSWMIIASLFILILFLGITNWIANWVLRRQMMRTMADIVLSLATDAFEASIGHDLSFFDEFSSGRILSRVTSDTRDFGQLLSFLTDLVSQIFGAVILAIVLLRIDWRLALLTFVLIPIVFLVAISYRRVARRVTRRGMQAMANVNAAIKETVSGIAVAKNFRQEGSIYKDFDAANQLSFNVNVQRGLVLATVFPSLNALGGIATGFMVYFGGLSAAQGLVTVGAWYLFLLSLDRFMFPIMNLSSFWTQVQNGLSAAERVFALIDAEAAVVQLENHHVPILTGQIDFEHVYFRYKEK
jgi:ATP-binding cassette, subfamily B, bacterial